jgi:L-ascorbate metabolism protein UlaG (beta-lactamase superfamily)
MTLPCAVLAATLAAASMPASAQDSKQLLNAQMEDGSAAIWHLGHAGWAVKTRSHLLIFDYVPGVAQHCGRSLDCGFIDPIEIAGQDIIVFVSHAHGDHYDPGILGWKDQVEDIEYVFGWENQDCTHCVCLSQAREFRAIDGIEIATVNHQFDGIPEVAFLVTVDGLVMYHSGDHGSVADDLNPVFKENIDYLANMDKPIDIAFISTFGRIGGGIVNNGDRYTIATLKPNITFPMHHGRNEDLYQRFAQEIAKESVNSQVYYAERPGDLFWYENGRIERH